MKLICRTLGWAAVAVLAFAAQSSAKPAYGTLSGVVIDPSGMPQMGARVSLISEDSGGRIVSQLMSNRDGVFSADRLRPGRYAVRVSLAGFLPATDTHIAVMADLTTLLRVQVSSVFSSLDTLRRKPNATVEADDWKWVLRSSAATRTILQWQDGDPNMALASMGQDLPKPQQPRGLVEVTNGTTRPWSPSNLPNAPATTVSYDQKLGDLGQMLFAGQMSYLDGASGAFATVWLPSGSSETGPETIFVVHQTRIGTDGVNFQGVRIDHTERMAFGDHLLLRAGSEFLRMGMVSSVTALRPHAQLDATFSPSWTSSMIFAANPPAAGTMQGDALESAADSLDSLPAVLIRDGRPTLEGGWHEEISVKHKLTKNSSVEAAGFHDSAQHQAIFGTGPAANPDFIQDTLSSAFLYDGGETSSWGMRVVYRSHVSDNVAVGAVYAWAGALAPGQDFNPADSDLRESLVTRNYHSLAGRVSAKVPRTRTQVTASYKWVSGAVLTRVDSFGEAASQIDPYLHLSIRQPLPGLNGRWVALADFSNLLAQGYVTGSASESQITLVPVLRTFRGGVSFQF